MNCSSLESVDLTSLQGLRVQELTNMFKGCTKLTTIVGLDGIDASNVTYCDYMFYNCQAIENINLSTFTLNNANVTSMFQSCYKLSSLTLSDNFNFDASKSNFMFRDTGHDVDGDCTIFGVTDSGIKTKLSTALKNNGNTKMKIAD